MLVLRPSPKLLIAGGWGLSLIALWLLAVHVPTGSEPVLFGAWFLLFYAWLMLRLGVDRWTIGVQIAALLCYALYFSYTRFNERNPDALDQLRYIQYLAKHGALPPPSDCLVCHHPPLYYALASAAWRSEVLQRALPGARGLQAVSLLLAAAYLAHVPLILQRYTQDRRLVALGTAVFGLWPSTVLQCCRVHNDSLANLWIVAGLYWLIRGHQERRAVPLLISALFASAAVFTKSSGYVLVTTLGACIIWHWVTTFRQSGSWRMLLPIVVLLVGCLSIRGLDRYPHNAPLCEHIFGKACSIRWTELTNDWTTYTRFALRDFLDSPYLVVSRKQLEYRYFWNCLLKSSLFGLQVGRVDAEMARSIRPTIATVLNYLLLTILTYTAVTTALMGRRFWSRVVPLLLYFVLAVLSMVVFRYVIPSPHHCDFRHIHPVLVLGVVFLVCSIESYSGRSRSQAMLGVGLSVAMTALSVVFFVPSPS